MKMTLNEVLENYKSLAELAEKKFPVSFSYAISKNLKKLESEVKLIEKGRSDLIMQYCEKDEEGKAKSDSKGNLVFGNNAEKFISEYNEYLETETEVEIHKISFAEIERTEDSRYDILLPAELMGIEFMIEEEA